MLGKVVDERYRLVHLLGTGGMGNVYEAVHQGTGRRVAVKVIATAELANDTGAIARFQREAKAAGCVETPHIVQVLDAGTDRATGTPYIAMEFLVGDDLKELSDHLGPLDAHLALRVVGQACAGLQKAHESGIVHRDIKPANLFLARQPDGRIIVKVLDFGIAKLPSKLLSGADALSATTTGRLLGSPLFMSPEQIRGLRTLNHRTDIWSLGAVLYQALAGRPPFAECETVGQLMVAICSQEPPPVEQVAPWVRPEAAAIVKRALKLEADERYPFAQDMLADILALLPGGTEIDESQLVSASGRPVPTQWYDHASTTPGTESLDDDDRFLVEPQSPRSATVESPKPRVSPKSDSGSTMPSASDGFLRPSGARSRRGRMLIAPLALLAGVALAGAVWLAQPNDGTTATPRFDPASASPEGRTATPIVEPPVPRETTVALEPTAVGVEAGARAQAGVVERSVLSTKEPRKKSVPAASSSSTTAPPASALFAAAALPSAPVATAVPEPLPAVRASAETAPPESPWTLDRKFPGKKGAP